MNIDSKKIGGGVLALLMVTATFVALVGNASAFAEPVAGQINLVTGAEGQTVILWVEDDRINNPNQNMTTTIRDAGPGNFDTYYFDDIEQLLLAHGKTCGDPFNVTVAMLCSGRDQNGNPYTNTYHNDTGVTQTDTYCTAGPTIMPMLNIEECCVPEIEVNKTVWNGTDWVDVTSADVGDTVRFKIWIHNNASCCDPLMNIVVTDVLSESLEYADNATVNGVACEPEKIIPNNPAPGQTTLKWYYNATKSCTDPFQALAYCQVIEIEFDATKITDTQDTNCANVSAWCVITVTYAYDDDCATVNPPGMPDLIVPAIDINPGCSKVTDELFANEWNNIKATVENIGTAPAVAPFNVSLKVDGTLEYRATVTTDIPAGGSTNVWLGWTPTATGNVVVRVTADDPGNNVTEIDEGNNSYEDTYTVYYSGYKGKRLTGGNDIATEQYHELKGDLIYSTGDSKDLSGYYNPDWTTYMANWTAADLPIPAGATIEKARLYIYYNYDKTTGGDITNYLSMSFNTNPVAAAATYTDRKGFGSYDKPSGTIAYDVTGYFNPGATNEMVLSNSYPGGDNVTIAQALLVVIYGDNSKSMKQIWINEECDMLNADNRYCVVADEATAYAPFAGTIDTSEVGQARLITVVQSGDAGSGNKQQDRLYLNGVEIGADIYNAGYKIISIDDRSVDTALLQSSNEASIQSYDGTEERGDYITAANAFLVLSTNPIVEVDAPDTCVNGTFTVDINVDTRGGNASVYAVQYDLSFDPDVIRILDQHQGTFLSENGAVDTMVVINEFDNVAGTASYSETRRDTLTGTSTPGPLASITFTTVGDPLDCSDITLSGVVVSDAGAQEISAVIENDDVCICAGNIPPTAVAKSDHKYNNVGSVFTCEATLNGSESTDPDGVIVQWSWACGDGGYESGEIAQHIYNTYQWTGSAYTPFTATLTVTDDDSATDDDDCEVIVYIAGDANGDGTVNILDAAMIGLRWMKTCNDYPGVCWGAEEMADRADLNNDCEVNILDAVIVGTQWGNNA